MRIKQIVSVLLTILLTSALFVPAGLAESPAEETAVFTVAFRDWDGTQVGDAQQVIQGADAAAPVHPARDGYEPDGWDKPFTNVQSDLVITAQYKELETPISMPPVSAGLAESPAKEEAAVFTVVFRDWDGTQVGDAQQVVQGADAVAPAHPTRDGYEPDGWDKPFTNVQSDLVITAQYKELETYTLTVNYLFEDGGVAAQPYIATVKAGESFDYDVNSPAVAGFHPDQTRVSGTLNDADVTVTVLYLPDGATGYTVHHYIQDLDGEGYSLHHSETLSGVTGSLVTAAAADIEGFTPQAVMPSGRISADGNMALAVYYARNTYTVYFVTEGAYIDPVSYQYGAAVAAWPTAATRAGYSFGGWDIVRPATMPAHDITVTAKWTANTNTGYTLVYWLENTTGTGYDYVGAAARTGTTGAAPSIPGSVPSGVTFPIGSGYRAYDSAKTLAEMPSAIAGDGTTIVNVYYSRNTYTITFKLNGGSMTIGGVTYNNSRDYTITAKYGAYIGDKWPAVSPTKSGTTFTGWKKSGGTNYVTRQYFMDNDLSGATLTAQYGSSKQVTIYYYFENLAGDTGGTRLGTRYYRENTAYRQTVNADRDTNSWSAKTFDGFTILSGYSSVSLVNNTATFYYTRNAYTLSFYSNGSLVSSAEHQYGADISSAAPVPDNGPAGYMFAGWYANQEGYGSPYTLETMPAYSLILYAKWVPVVYTVTFDPQGGSTVDAQRVENGGHAAAPADPTRAGYIFDGWYLTGESVRFVFDREIHGDITLQAKWRPSTDIAYTVKFVDGDGAPLAEPMTITGQTMGSTVYVEAVPIDHYLPDKVSKSLMLGASGNEIVFHYTPFVSVDYTVRHIAADGSFDHATTVTTQNAVVTANYANHPGYSPDAYQKTLVLSMDAASNVITFHYTKNADKAYTVRHYQQNLGVSGYTLADTETLSGPVGYRATAVVQSYTGFVYNAGISNASGTITSNGSLVLNLYYDRVTYTLSYDANGGIGAMAPQSGAYQSTAAVAANGFERTNHVFAAWNTAADGSGAAYAPDDVLTLTGNVTLYAQWREKAKYAVAYDANGGSGTMSDPHSPYYDGASFTVLTNGFDAPANKHFTGWNSQADGSGMAYAAGSAYVIAADVTLYAQWTYNDRYTVTYYGNGGTGTVTDTHSPYYDGNSVTVLENGFTYFGYNFTGWNTAADGSGAAYAPGVAFTISADVALYAQWEKDASLWYHVTYDGNENTGGIVPVDSAEYLKNTPVAVKTGVPTRTNAVFLGWSTTRHALVTTQAQADAVVFVGGSFIILSDTTLYAVWAEDANGPDGGPDGTPDYRQYGLVYDGNGATGGSVPVNGNIYSPGAAVPVADNTGDLQRTGAVFLGWSASQAALVTQATDVPTPLYAGGNSIPMVTGGVTLYAVWAEDTNGPGGGPDGVPDYLEFSVTYDKNSADATGTVTDGNIYPDNYSVTVKPNGFARTNHVFDHWNTASDDTGTSAAPGSTFRIHADTVFYAIWELDENGPDGGPDGIPDKIEYRVIYDANGGDAASVPVDGSIYPQDYSVPVKFSPVPVRIGYDFLGWAASSSAALPDYAADGTMNLTMGTGDVTLYAVWTPHVYRIAYELGGGENHPDNPSTYTVESADIVLKDPAKAGHTFGGWTPSDSIPAGSMGDKTFTASWTINTYTVTWNDEDGTLLEQDEDVAYGATPSYDGATPEKAATAEFTYAFSGWTPAVSAVTGDVIYTAQYMATTNTYIVTWNDEDGTLLEQDEDVAYGTTPSYDGATPEKAATAEFTYTFSGWAPAVSAVTGDATYTAQYTSTTNTYSVTWNDEDGTLLERDEDVAYGTTPSYDGATPTKAATAEFTYAFSGWAPAVSAVTGDVIYTAQYTATTNTYSVTWNDEDGTLLELDEDVAYGTTPSYDGATPTKAATAEFTYTFSGWTPEVSAVTGDATYTAQYMATTNTYIVTWNDEDGTLLEQDEDVPYGTAPSYDGATPTKAATAEFTYTFSGWTPAVSAVTGDVIYTAQYTATTNTYTVTFVDHDGTVLGIDSVAYGGAATAPANPTRGGYTFTGWDMPFDHITHDLTVTAAYEAIVVPTPSPTPTPSPSVTPSPAPSTTPSPTVTPSPAPGATPSPAVTPPPSVSPAPLPSADAEEPQVIDDEPVPTSGPRAAWAWWLLLIPLLLLLLLLYNVSVMVYGRDGKGQEKLLRTIRRLKRKKDEVIVSLKDRDVSGGTHGMVELTKVFTRRMRDRKLTLEVEGAQVLSVVIPHDADGRFQARIDSWDAGR